MLKAACRFVVPCVSVTLALFLLPNGPLSRLTGAEIAQPQRQQQAAPAAGTTSAVRKTIEVKRAPARVIKDPNSSFSAVAVDVAHNEVVLQDENLGQIMVYGRTDNTPPAQH